MGAKSVKLNTYVLFLLILFCPSVFAQQEVTIKIATLAPVGSVWYDLLDSSVRNIKERHKGVVKIMIYPGGVMGDEEEVLKKIKMGQLHGGAFTINGVKKIVPETGILDLPMLFKNYEEIDEIIEKFKGYFGKLFEERNFKLLAFSEEGVAYFFSKQLVSNLKDLGKTRFWAWAGEPIDAKVPEVLGTKPIFLRVPDVLTALETGMIESFHSSPEACLSLQWCNHVKIAIDLPFRYEHGALVMYKKSWDSLPADVKRSFEEEFKEFERRSRKVIRDFQEKAKERLRNMGVKFIKLSQEDEAWLREQVRNKIWFSQDLKDLHTILNKVIEELKR